MYIHIHTRIENDTAEYISIYEEPSIRTASCLTELKRVTAALSCRQSVELPNGATLRNQSVVGLVCCSDNVLNTMEIREANKLYNSKFPRTTLNDKV